MKLILGMYPRLRFYNTINEGWFSLLAPTFWSGTLLGSPSRPSKGQAGMAITLIAGGWGMAVTQTVTSEAYRMVEGCWCDKSWWTSSGISVRDWAATLLIGFKEIWEGLECSYMLNDPTSPLTHWQQWRPSHWLQCEQEWDSKAHFCCQNSQSRSSLQPKKCIYELKCNTCHFPVKTSLHV